MACWPSISNACLPLSACGRQLSAEPTAAPTHSPITSITPRQPASIAAARPPHPALLAPASAMPASASASSGWGDWLPLAVAAAAAAGVAYLALSQAGSAAWQADEEEQRQRQAAQARKAAKQPAVRARPLFSAPAPRKAGAAEPASPAAAPPAAAPPAAAPPAAAPPAPEATADEAPDAAPRQCAHCHKVPEKQDALARCSRCRNTWYCDQACQRTAWPEHKRVCAKPGSAPSSAVSSPTAAQAASSAGSSSSSSAGSGEQQQQGSDGASGAAPSSPPTSEASPANAAAASSSAMMEALHGYLSQHSAAGQADALTGQFEAGVLLFVRGEHSAALGQLQAVQAAAEAGGQLGVAGDASKWAAHALVKLGERGKAAAAFAAGAELGERAGSKKLQVDCLSGMGAMYRDAGQLEAAEGFLRQALKHAASDDALRAGVLTHLGGVLVARDAPAALLLLEEAVGIREDQVITLHDAGTRGSALASAIMEHAGSLVALAGAYYVAKRYSDAADAYSKSLSVFELIEDADKAAKCLVNLANLYELQLQHADSRAEAAAQRRKLYALSRAALGREAPETCSICCEPISPLAPTRGEDDKLLLLGCLHCFHHRCWEDWSEKQATCPACKPASR